MLHYVNLETEIAHLNVLLTNAVLVIFRMLVALNVKAPSAEVVMLVTPLLVPPPG